MHRKRTPVNSSSIERWPRSWRCRLVALQIASSPAPLRPSGRRASPVPPPQGSCPRSDLLWFLHSDSLLFSAKENCVLAVWHGLLDGRKNVSTRRLLCFAGFSELWESGNPGFGFPLFHSFHSPGSPVLVRWIRIRRSCGNGGISPPLRDFQGAEDRAGNLPLVFHPILSSVISTALRRSGLSPTLRTHPCAQPLS